MRPSRLALASLLALSACRSTPTSPNAGPASAVRIGSPNALAGAWAGTYPSGQRILYTFTATGTQAPNWRTGHQAWYYSATYKLGDAAPVPFDVYFEPPKAYWGSLSSGTLTNPTTMTVQGAARPFIARKR